MKCKQNTNTLANIKSHFVVLWKSELSHILCLPCLSEAYLVTHVTVRHVSVTHVSVTQDSVTHVSVKHVSVTHVSVTPVSMMHVSVRHVSVTHASEACLSSQKMFQTLVNKKFNIYPDSQSSWNWGIGYRDTMSLKMLTYTLKHRRKNLNTDHQFTSVTGIK
jgi:hypothetical protein